MKGTGFGKAMGYPTINVREFSPPLQPGMYQAVCEWGTCIVFQCGRVAEVHVIGEIGVTRQHFTITNPSRIRPQKPGGLMEVLELGFGAVRRSESQRLSSSR